MQASNRDGTAAKNSSNTYISICNTLTFDVSYLQYCLSPMTNAYVCDPVYGLCSLSMKNNSLCAEHFTKKTIMVEHRLGGI